MSNEKIKVDEAIVKDMIGKILRLCKNNLSTQEFNKSALISEVKKIIEEVEV